MTKEECSYDTMAQQIVAEIDAILMRSINKDKPYLIDQLGRFLQRNYPTTAEVSLCVRRHLDEHQCPKILSDLLKGPQ